MLWITLRNIIHQTLNHLVSSIFLVFIMVVLSGKWQVQITVVNPFFSIYHGDFVCRVGVLPDLC